MDFVFFDAGGGHRASATALKQVIEAQGRPWEVRLVNLQETLDRIDILRRATGLRIQDAYNGLLNRGWTLGAPQLLKVLQAAIRLFHGRAVRELAALWRRTEPAMVVSLVPNFNRQLYEGARLGAPGAPFVTVLTDIADYPPHFWIERGQEQYFICGSDRAAEQARAMGHPPERVLRTSGMIIHPRFYEPVAVDRAAGRERLGLRPDLATGLVLFGGVGPSKIYDIVEELEAAGLNLQLIAICGRNDKLAARLRARRWRLPLFVEGFTREVPLYMHLSDFMIGKPGPGSLSEALAMGLPVVVELNRATLPQERYNAAWVRQAGLGAVVRSMGQVAPAVRALLEPENFTRVLANVVRVNNRAVFEIPNLLAAILAREGRTAH